MKNQSERALLELRGMDDLAASDSPVHRLSPAAKLLTTVIYIMTVVSFHKYDLSGVILMILYPAVLFAVTGIPAGLCFRKLRFVLPLVLMVGIFNPFFDRGILLRIGGVGISGGVISMLTLMLKGTFCLMASFLLMASTGIDALCAALRKLRIPAMLTTLLLLTYRYVSVMTEELAVMTDAYSLRAPGQKGIKMSAWGSFLGQLLLRSMDRAEELYSSMQLRGFRGEFHYAEAAPFRWKDALYAALWAALFFLLRFGNVAELAGGLLM